MKKCVGYYLSNLQTYILLRRLENNKQLIIKINCYETLKLIYFLMPFLKRTRLFFFMSRQQGHGCQFVINCSYLHQLSRNQNTIQRNWDIGKQTFKLDRNRTFFYLLAIIQFNLKHFRYTHSIILLPNLRLLHDDKELYLPS